MGKRKQGVKYEHNHTYNAAARESEDRKMNRLRGMEVKRLRNNVEKQIQNMQRYIPPEKRKKQRIDPNYDLKGAARVAREFYQDPNYEAPPEEVNLFEQYQGHMWDHAEGQEYLSLMYELAVGLHNIGQKSNEAIDTFSTLLEQDPEDHMEARHSFLRCYMDMGMAAEARALMEQFPHDSSACFAYTLALIEHISHALLQEDDASEQIANEALEKAISANPYVVWTLVYAKHFSAVLGENAQIPDIHSTGDIIEALQFFEKDAAVWLDTDGAVEWVQSYLTANHIVPPIFDDDEEDPEEEEEQEDDAGASEEDVEAAAAVLEQEAKIDECIEKYRIAIEAARSAEKNVKKKS